MKTKRFSLNLLLTAFVATGSMMILTSCDGAKKATPADEVKDYGKYFVEKISARQLDSLKNTYSEISLADSIVSLKSDSINVVETASGKYDVTIAQDVTLKITRGEDGSIKVTESKGLFAYPAEKIEFAKNTGMWDESLNDAQLCERMKDTEFEKFVAAKMMKKTGKIISIGEVKGNFMDNNMYQTLTNNTDVPIKGSEYTINMVELVRDMNEYGMMDYREDKFTKPGKDIAPHGSIKIHIEGYYGGAGEDVRSISWKISPEEKARKFASYSGKEYQEYLETKK